MPILRANRTEPLSLTADSLNTGVTFAVDFAGDDGVPYVGANSPTKNGTLPLITTSVGTNSGRDVSNGGASGINQYRWDDATKVGIPAGVAEFTFWLRLRTPSVTNSVPTIREIVRLTNGTAIKLSISQYELSSGFGGYGIYIDRDNTTNLITYSDTGAIIAPDTVYDVHLSRTAAGAYKIYINGVLRKTGTGFSSDFTVVAGSAFSYFGAVNHGTRNAVLIDAMTWTRQLSDSEVTAHQADPYSYQANSGVTVSGAASWTEANDTASGAGSLAVSGSGATAEANDTAAASGTVGNVVSGTAAYTEANDTATAAGVLTVSGSSATTEASDTASASGTVTSAYPVITITGIKNNTGTLRASETFTAFIHNESTGALVVKLTGQTTDGSGNLVLTDAALSAATAYRVDLKDSAGNYGVGVRTSV